METIDRDIITLIILLIACCSAPVIIGAIATLAWLKDQRDWHKKNGGNK
jgi:hypothetical protein